MYNYFANLLCNLKFNTIQYYTACVYLYLDENRARSCSISNPF